jgi:hypothetical protein
LTTLRSIATAAAGSTASTRRTARGLVGSRRARRRAAAAGSLVLILGATSAAAASASTPSPSPSTSTESDLEVKPAGFFNKLVRVAVVNKTTEKFDADMCQTLVGNVGCVFGLGVSPEVEMQRSAEYTSMQGKINLPGTGVIFSAVNPDVGVPYFKLETADKLIPGQTESPFWRADGIGLVEGEIQQRTIGGHLVQVERRGDSGDYKEMRISSSPEFGAANRGG